MTALVLAACLAFPCVVDDIRVLTMGAVVDCRAVRARPFDGASFVGGPEAVADLVVNVRAHKKGRRVDTIVMTELKRHKTSGKRVARGVAYECGVEAAQEGKR